MADTLFIIVFASAIGILLLYKLLESTLKVILTFVPLLVFTLSAEQLPHLNGSMPYVVLLGGLMAFGFLFVKKFPESKAQIIISVCTFGLAILFRSFDMELCSQVVIGTHFLWHIFVALIGYQLVLLVMNKYSKTSMI